MEGYIGGGSGICPGPVEWDAAARVAGTLGDVVVARVPESRAITAVPCLSSSVARKCPRVAVQGTLAD